MLTPYLKTSCLPSFMHLRQGQWRSKYFRNWPCLHLKCEWYLLRLLWEWGWTFPLLDKSFMLDHPYHSWIFSRNRESRPRWKTCHCCPILQQCWHCKKQSRNEWGHENILSARQQLLKEIPLKVSWCKWKWLEQRSKLTFLKSRLLATFNCKMVAMKKIQSPKTKKKREGEDTSWHSTHGEKNSRGRTLHDVLHEGLMCRTVRFQHFTLVQ